MLKAEDMVFSRGESGDLIAQEVELDMPGNPTVKIKPLTRGKLQEVYAKAKSSDLVQKAEADTDVIKAGLVEPKLTDEQIADMKPQMAAAVSTAIMAVSMGISQKEVAEKAQEIISQEEAELKKN